MPKVASRKLWQQRPGTGPWVLGEFVLPRRCLGSEVLNVVQSIKLIVGHRNRVEDLVTGLGYEVGILGVGNNRLYAESPRY